MKGTEIFKIFIIFQLHFLLSRFVLFEFVYATCIEDCKLYTLTLYMCDLSISA
jgi:hypothetical protein